MKHSNRVHLHKAKDISTDAVILLIKYDETMHKLTIFTSEIRTPSMKYHLSTRRRRR